MRRRLGPRRRDAYRRRSRTRLPPRSQALAEARVDPPTPGYASGGSAQGPLVPPPYRCTASPEVLESVADQAHRLSELLGDHHDLAVLAEDAAGRPAS